MLKYLYLSTMNQITLRKATAKDLSTLLEFEQGVIEAERPLDPTIKHTPTTYYDLNEMLTAKHIHLIVAEINNEIISCGYARIEKAKEALQHTCFGYLGFMYTLPKHRGKGINKNIISELTAWCKKKDVHEIRLHVYHGNKAAIRAYEKVGFTKHMIEMRIK